MKAHLIRDSHLALCFLAQLTFIICCYNIDDGAMTVLCRRSKQRGASKDWAGWGTETERGVGEDPPFTGYSYQTPYQENTNSLAEKERHRTPCFFYDYEDPHPCVSTLVPGMQVLVRCANLARFPLGLHQPPLHRTWCGTSQRDTLNA